MFYKILTQTRITEMSSKFFSYIKNLSISKLILWFYFLWWLAISIHYFPPSSSMITNSLVMSFAVGIVLNLNAMGQKSWKEMETWTIIRFFLIPFCVSFYASISQQHNFILLFPSELSPLLLGFSFCFVFTLFVFIAKRV